MPYLLTGDPDASGFNLNLNDRVTLSQLKRIVILFTQRRYFVIQVMYSVFPLLKLLVSLPRLPGKFRTVFKLTEFGNSQFNHVPMIVDTSRIDV